MRIRKKTRGGIKMKKDLSKDQIRDIIQMKADGHSITEIMDKYPFIKTRSTIYYHLYKAPAEKQNNMILLHKKLDDVLHKLQNIEQYLSMQSIVQNTVQDKPEIIQNNVQYTKSPASGEIFIKVADLVKHIWVISEGKQALPDTIRKIFKIWNFTTDDPQYTGYPLSGVIEVLRKNNQKKRAKKLDISELEKLL
jgi:hypothetical protein